MAALIKTLGDALIGGRNKTNSDTPFLADETVWFEILKRCDRLSLLRAEQVSFICVPF